MSVPVPNPALVPPGISGPAAPGAPPAPSSPLDPARFAQLLDARRIGVQFSNHAVQRLQRRGIDVQPATLQRLDDAVGRAAGKGARDAVVFVDGTAFVVSVRNRTVVTAVDRDHMRDHVFTNIDSAVIG
ncbi:MAG TPA: TIGR02530 family flagellar biosynthesis protein [Solirubrobacteraceae bacterium]|nr:TIGR02530 family flagellar biosynthesis protein [Solirubrobacteraceae bacterium]